MAWSWGIWMDHLLVHVGPSTDEITVGNIRCIKSLLIQSMSEYETLCYQYDELKIPACLPFTTLHGKFRRFDEISRPSTIPKTQMVIPTDSSILGITTSFCQKRQLTWWNITPIFWITHHGWPIPKVTSISVLLSGHVVCWLGMSMPFSLTCKKGGATW